MNTGFRISLPFVSGVYAGYALCCIPALSPAVSSSIALTLTLLCMVLLLKGGRADKVIVSVMVFTLGVFCFCAGSADLYPSSRLDCGALIEPLKRLIGNSRMDRESTVPLLNALMTGDRSGLGRGTVEIFRKSGASHLLALSGLHLGIVSSFIDMLLKLLGNSRVAEYIRSGVLVLLCGIYTLACGASASLVRAFIFVVFSCISRLCRGRRMDGAERLCWAAAIQSAARPAVVCSLAFQLSYLAMVGVIVIAPRMAAWYPSTAVSRRFDPMRKIWKGASMAIACQLMTSPLVYFRFGSLPKYFLLTNLLAMPLCELLIPVALVTLLLGSPAPLVRLTDLLSGAMLRTLGIIAEM